MAELLYLFKGGNIMDSGISILDVANAFLTFKSMTHKKLQKLCYYAQAWHLTINDEPLVEDVNFEAWVHGPVCPELYQAYKEYGASRITKKNSLPKNILKDSYEYAFLYGIFKKYGHLSGNQLETLTHTEEPWRKARAKAGAAYWEPTNEKILEEDMINYYGKKNN